MQEWAAEAAPPLYQGLWVLFNMQEQELNREIQDLKNTVAKFTDKVEAMEQAQRNTELTDTTATSGIIERRAIGYAARRKGGYQYSTEAPVATGNFWVNGKELYELVLDFGTLPNNSTDTVNFATTIGNRLIGVAYYQGFWYETSTTGLPTVMFDGSWLDDNGDDTDRVKFTCGTSACTVRTFRDRTAYTAHAIIGFYYDDN